MALRREDLRSEDPEVQAARARSLEQARRDLADPEFRAYLDASIARLDAMGPTKALTREEFLVEFPLA